MKSVIRIATVSAALFAAGSASAAPFSLTPDLADAGVHTGSGAVAQDADFAVRVGEYFGPSQAYVFAFEVPSIPISENVVSADLQINIYEQINTPDLTYNLDLYGLGTRAAADVLAGDAFEGALDAGNTLIADDFITVADGIDTVNTTASEDAALVAYLNAQFASASAGDFVFFRLNPDSAVPNTNNAYGILTANAGLPGEAPVLSFVTDVPEPASLALIGLGSVALLGGRRKA